jgi:hypothetical protein
MRLVYSERRNWMLYRAYLHPTRGVIRTTALTLEPNVIHVWGPNFGAGERVREFNKTRRNRRRRTDGTNGRQDASLMTTPSDGTK